MSTLLISHFSVHRTVTYRIVIGVRMIQLEKNEGFYIITIVSSVIGLLKWFRLIWWHNKKVEGFMKARNIHRPIICMMETNIQWYWNLFLRGLRNTITQSICQWEYLSIVNVQNISRVQHNLCFIKCLSDFNCER